jgi:pSer/pThr/pTyr-binding forkhead associated (FHA) protein
MKIGCLTLTEGAESGKRILLKNLSVFEAGRSQGNHICLKDPSVAMSHFRIYRSGQQFSIYDLGTKKGTLVNGGPVEKLDLKPSDVIQAGDVKMFFDLVDEETPGRLASSAPDSSENDAQAFNGGVLTKTAASTPTLVVVDGDERGRRLPLVGKNQFKIGRSVTSDLKLLDGKISRDHCVIEVVRDHHIIVDLESANGTIVNGERIKKSILKEGDFIRLGYTMLKYDRV